MRAGSSDRKVILPAPHQNRVFAIDAAFDDGAFRKISNGNAGPKIQLISLFHACLPVMVSERWIDQMRYDGEFESIACNLQLAVLPANRAFGWFISPLSGPAHRRWRGDGANSLYQLLVLSWIISFPARLAVDRQLAGPTDRAGLLLQDI
jgi:hypothetical protein